MAVYSSMSDSQIDAHGLVKGPNQLL